MMRDFEKNPEIFKRLKEIQQHSNQDEARA